MDLKIFLERIKKNSQEKMKKKIPKNSKRFKFEAKGLSGYGASSLVSPAHTKLYKLVP